LRVIGPPGPAWHGRCSRTTPGEGPMNNIFYIIGVVVVVLFILGYLGFR
jgi:hypothetical protein